MQNRPDIGILVVSVGGEACTWLAYGAGAGCLLKGAEGSDLVEAVRGRLSGKSAPFANVSLVRHNLWRRLMI